MVLNCFYIVFVDEDPILIDRGFSNLLTRSDAPRMYGALKYLIGLSGTLVLVVDPEFSDCLINDLVNYLGNELISDIFYMFSSSEVMFSALQICLARLTSVLITLRF